jgi:hypothetical protein
MQDFSHEASVLDCIEESLEDKSLLVSYNGKSFDIPLLINRFVLYKKDDCFSGLMHIDLVHTARRLWKDKLLFCNLQNIEKQMLGFKREGDIPGGDIPQLYFDYLQTGNLLALKPVFQHNVIDILSMLAIFIRAAQVYKSPKSESEIWGVIKTYEKLKLFDLAELNYQQHEHQILPENSIQYQLGRAQNLKKLKKYGKAKQIWQYLIEKNGSFIPAAYIELLKHIEHRERKFKDAYQIIEHAQKKLDILRQLRDIPLYPELDQEFDTRKIRLLKRLKNECV